jgi:hypothetical protein
MTAVEWLITEIDQNILVTDKVKSAVEQAKEMEKQQIIEAHFEGQCDKTEGYPIKIAEQYYNETFKNTEK